jgi:hypothetical protein
MFGRIFGRGKDDNDQAVCAECGRTLLAGEWTQTVVDEHGDERLICSLCGQAYAGAHEPVAAAPAPANNGRVRETRSESVFDERPGSVFGDEPGSIFGEPSGPAFDAAPAFDDVPAAAFAPAAAAAAVPARDAHAESDAFWQALKDKDSQIESLKAELARAEAERQELAGRFARVGAAEPTEPGSLTGDSSEPGERTWGETPAEFAAEMAALRESEQAQTYPPAPVQDEPAFAAPESSPYDALEPEPAADMDVEAPVVEETAEAVVVEEVAAEQRPADDAPAAAAEPDSPAAQAPPVHPVVFEDTQPIPTIDAEMLAAAEEEDGASTGEIAASEAAAAVAAAGGALPGEPSPATGQPAVPTAAEAEAAAASLTLLQRGVDLLNVSRVPRKIAETNEQLGLPHVHVGFDGETVAVTFMWSMGWYRFHVDIDSGDVSMDDRGYEELTLQPNAGVRADGTVQLAPAQISRAAAAQRTQAPPEPAPEPAISAQPAAPAAEPETPREAAQKAPEFLSKSLLGQRSDDESASWEQTTARDFDWDR